MRLIIGCAVLAATTSLADLPDRVEQLEKRVQNLEQTVARLTGESEAAAPGRSRDELKQAARERMRRDTGAYSSAELRSIETLYQEGSKQWKTEEGRAKFKELVEKYDQANRTGCALLYLGRKSTGDEQIEFLTMAAGKFGDCWYGDGTQVGPYAKFVLAGRYLHDGEKEKAEALIGELKQNHPDAIMHNGKRLVDILSAEGY